MKKISLGFLVLLLPVFGCVAEEVEDVVEEIVEVVEEVPEEVSELSLQEIFDSLPLDYCDDFMREPVLIYDEANYYMMTGTDLEDGNSHPSYDYCEFTIFKNTSSGEDIYGIVHATVTPMLLFGGMEFLKNVDDEWIDVSEEVFEVVDMDILEENCRNSVAGSDLVEEGLEMNYYMVLPQYGTTIEFVHHNTGDTVYEIKWNGVEFVVNSTS